MSKRGQTKKHRLKRRKLISEAATELLSTKISKSDRKQLKSLIYKPKKRKKRKKVRLISKKKKSTWKRDYHIYIQSKEWKELREQVLERDDYHCVYCYSTENLQVHHLTYKNFKHEELKDLITLCKSCHRGEHLEKSI